ncbi:MAG: mannose-phosphate guanylyltransferase [Actinomycetota bacterium]|nr:mannose-phosphate guanylyltransferase [Actinomycetota bacterium]
MTLQAVVLLGGIGTRLRPLTYATPKQALPIVEVPMIERVLAHLLDHGVTGAVLSLGYLHHAFASLFAEGRYRSMDVRFAVEPEPLDTGGAIRFAATEAGVDERFLVVNGDVLTDLDITAMLEFHDSRDGAEGTIALAHVADCSAFGMVVTEAGSGRVERFVEKPPVAEAGPGDVNAGTYVFEPRVLRRIAQGRRVSVEREVFPAVVADRGLFAFPSAAYWTDTGTPLQYLHAQLDIIGGRRPGVPAAGAVSDGDGVWRLGRATVDGEVRGPALLGVDARVARGASVRNSVVGAGAGVDDGAVVEDSVLLPGAWVTAGATVRGSVVGPGAVIGERASVTDGSIVGASVKVDADTVLVGARFPAGTATPQD